MRQPRLPVAPRVAAVLTSAGLLSLAWPAPVRAHGIESSLERLSLLKSDTFQLESRFSSGEPAQSATVRVVSPQGEAIEVGQTNGEGQLKFQLPRQAGSDWEVQVDAGPGHRDYLELDPGALSTAPARRLQQPERWLDQRTQLVVGLTGVGLGAAGVLRLRRRQR
jgi:nickel transport protein